MHHRPLAAMCVCLQIALPATVLFAGGVARHAVAQTLDLNQAPALPPLRGERVTHSMSETLRAEIDDLERASTAPTDALAATIRAARLEYRRLAFDLLVRASGTDGPVDIMAMHGFRLADARRRVDLRLERVIESTGLTLDGEPRPIGVREKDRVTRLLARFADVAPKAFSTAALTDLEQLDGALSVALAPLLDAFAILEERSPGDELGSGWPTLDQLGNAGATPTPLQPLVAIDPCAPTTHASVGPATARALASWCASSDASSPERMDIAQRAIRLSQAAMGAPWLDANQQADLDQRAAALFLDRGSRLLVLAQTALIEARSRLEFAEDAARDDLASLDRAVRKSLFPSADSGVALHDSPAELARLVQRLAESIEIAATARTDARRPVEKEYRSALIAAEKRYRKGERAVWSTFDAMLADADALANPAYTGLVRDQRESLKDLDRIASAQGLIDAIGGVRPQAARPLAGRMKTLIRWLNEPTRASDATLALDTLARHVAMFLPLPYERELRDETDEALAFTGGKAKELITILERARADWAESWGTGTGTDAAAVRMVALHRLTRVMDDLSQGRGAEDRNAVAALSRWGGFHGTRAALAPAFINVAAMTQLAVAAAIDGNADLLERELDRIERDAPLARLVGRLSRDLGPWLATRPPDVLGQLTAIRVPPALDAWGLSLRGRLAAILRTARELDAARKDARQDDERVLLAHLAKLAQAALETLVAEPSPLPTLPAFDEAPAPTESKKSPRKKS